MTAVADTGFVLAVTVATDEAHAACVSVYQQQRHIYLPQTTLAEIAYMLTRVGGNRLVARFLLSLERTKYRIVALGADDIRRTAEILERYADSRVDFVDATIAAVAERLDIVRVLTVDQRDFRILRPRHCEHFEILP